MINYISRKKSKGFTLFEVMIALTILSIAMISGIVTSTSVLERGIYIEKKLLAHWVGMNVLNKMELKIIKDKLEVSKTNGTDKLRGQDFDWNLDISKVKIDDIEVLEMIVTVYEAKNGNNKSSNILDQASRKVTLLI